MDQSHIDIAKGSLILANIPSDMRTSLLAHSRIKSLSRGETLFIQDDPADRVFIVMEGWVKLYRMTPSGSEAVVSVFTKGRSFGEAVALRASAYPVSAEAATDADIMEIPAADLLEMMRSAPDMAMAILSSTFAHLQNLVGQVEQLKAQTGAQRVAEFILTLCPVEEGACVVTLPYDKNLIAARLGIKPESLSRAFGKLKSSGITIQQNHAAVADVELLHAFIERDRSEAWSAMR